MPDMVDVSLFWVVTVLVVVIVMAVIIWRAGAVDKGKARESLSAWWRRLRGRD